METLKGFCFLAVLLSVMLSSAQAQNKETYVAVGGSMTLKPPEEVKDLTSILWKYNGNLVAEWVKDKVPLEIFLNYKGRTTLDTGTGLLTINKLTAADTGLYTVETNNRVQIVGLDVKVVKNLTKPEVVIKPLACDSNSPNCSLTCEGETEGTGPITYSWKMGDKDWAEMGKDMPIKNNDETRKIQTFSCWMKNPISVEESNPVENPFTQKPPSSGLGLVLGVFFIVLLIITVVVSLALIRFFKPQMFRSMFCLKDHTNGDSHNHNTAKGEPSEVQRMVEVKDSNITPHNPSNSN